MGNSADGFRWPSTTDDDYNAACDRCEVVVMVGTEAQRATLVRYLRYDKPPKGAFGRAITKGLLVWEPPLRAMGPLEPDRSLREVGGLEEVALLAVIIFWRMANQTLTRHRCPLLSSPELGLTPTRTLIVDALHTG